MIRRAFPAIVATLVLAAPAAATPVIWGGLTPGPHAAGFRVLFETDPGRAYFPLTGARDRSLARPIQITIWYPARAATGTAMRFGDYLDVASRELGPGRENREEVAREFREGPMRPFFDAPPPDDAWERILSVEVAARDGAQPAAGRFPLVLIAGGGGALSQGVLFEYLATHGWVVASVPLLGHGAAWHNRGEWSVRSIEEMAGDLRHAARTAAELPFVDANRIAVAGMAAGAQGVLYAMRSRAVGAIAALDSPWPEQIADSPHFDAAALRTPILDLPSAGSRRSDAGRDRLRYTDRTVVLIPESTHLDTYQFRRVALAGRATDAAEARRTIAAAHAQYEMAAELMHAFLDRHVRGDGRRWEELMRREVAAGLSIARDAALPPIPTEEDLLALVRGGDVATAARMVAEVREREPEIVLFDEEAMTTTARFLARDRGVGEAVEAFRLVAASYPNSPSAHETLGDVLARAGRHDDAAAAWRRALEVTAPDDAKRRARLEEKLDAP